MLEDLEQAQRHFYEALVSEGFYEKRTPTYKR